MSKLKMLKYPVQADLEYERTNNARLTQEMRRQATASLDTTCLGARGRVAAPQTSQPAQQSSNTSINTTSNTSLRSEPAPADTQSPVWSSGSGALKEMQLHELQVKTKSLEKDNARLREHEEFYINKAREWKNRALKYERSLKEKGFDVPSRDKGGEGKENTARNVKEGHSLVTQPAAADTTETKGVQQQLPSSPTIQLNLNQPREARRTEEDFRLPESTRKKDECKTQ